jgi:Na+/proline symporter
MLPPMIYRVMNPSLTGLESEGAYLLMCQKILPAGLMGLMLSAMISATASSANTILNLLAAVFTNDIYKKLFRPKASEKHAVTVGRLATVIFGLITIGLALLVPKVGGLVNVVLAIGAITGGSLLAPVIWTLFSRRQTAFSIFVTSVSALTLSLCFKFFTPFVFDFSLSRAQEMMVGIGFPLLVLALFEWVIYHRVGESVEYTVYRQKLQNKAVKDLQTQAAESVSSNAQNSFGIKAIAIGLGFTGLGILVLGLLAAQYQGLVAGMGFLIMLVGLPVWWLGNRSGKASAGQMEPVMAKAKAVR